MNLFKGHNKYLVFGAIAILIAYCFYFNHVFAKQEESLITNKALEKRQDIGLLAGLVDKLVEMDHETGGYHGFEEILIFAVQYTETEFHSTFAQVYDENMIPLIEQSPGVGGGKKHDPRDYQEFLDAVEKAKEDGTLAGDLVYTYDTPQAGSREVHMTFRWMPTDTTHSSQYLVAIGISKYTIIGQVDTLTIYGAVSLIVVTALFILFSVYVSVKRGDASEKRDKNV